VSEKIKNPYMSIRIQINNSDDPKSDYITWTFVPCRIISDELASRIVILRNKNSTLGGQVVFINGPTDTLDDSPPTGTPGDILQITLPPNSNVSFFIAGKFDFQTGKGFPSSADKDAIISMQDATTGIEIGQKPVMVRVRKNANTLSPTERNDFLDALVKLNQSGGYVELQNMHLSTNSDEIHHRSCFLPWHRAFLLHLERELQEITPSVALPYWKFDEGASNVFRRNFMGVPDSTGMVNFSSTNPLINWRLSLFGLGNGTRVRRDYASLRRHKWDPLTEGAIKVQNDENDTLNLGTTFIVNTYPSSFSRLESDPHGMAHSSFIGQISAIGTAPADPLFFLLHANVDRLWAKWQWLNGRYMANVTSAYPRQGNAPNPNQGGEFGIGNFTNDTMWPWNGATGSPRPPAAPGNGFPDSLPNNFPGTQPQVGNMIDFQGQISRSNNLNFAYDDVPYDIPAIV
jgi:tyrosinase